MKWKNAIIIGCFVISASLLTAWFVVLKKPLKPGMVPNFKLMWWLSMAGMAFFCIGTTVLNHLIAEMIAEKIFPFLKGFKKSDHESEK